MLPNSLAGWHSGDQQQLTMPLAGQQATPPPTRQASTCCAPAVMGCISQLQLGTLTAAESHPVSTCCTHDFKSNCAPPAFVKSTAAGPQAASTISSPALMISSASCGRAAVKPQAPLARLPWQSSPAACTWAALQVPHLKLLSPICLSASTATSDR